MSSGRQLIRISWTSLAVCALLVGCGESDTTLVESELPEDDLPVVEAPVAPADEDSKEPEPEKTAEKPDDLEEEQVVFSPPYPDRVSLFRAPKRQGRAFASREGQRESDVELLGFVNVDGQRVVLDIDGIVTPIAEGAKQYGIEVISIQPPSVVLQRGRQRFQATLDN